MDIYLLFIINFISGRVPRGMKFNQILTQNHKDENSRGEHCDRVKHHSKSMLDGRYIMAIRYQHRWKQKSNRYAQLLMTKEKNQ